MFNKLNRKEPKVRVNTIITGEPAIWLEEWKRRGLITSYTDGVIQAIRTLHEKITEQDLKTVRLRNLNKIEEEFCPLRLRSMWKGGQA